MKPNTAFANFLTFLITVGLFGLWVIPAYMLYHCPEQTGWGCLYFPLVLISVGWAVMLSNTYLKSE